MKNKFGVLTILLLLILLPKTVNAVTPINLETCVQNKLCIPLCTYRSSGASEDIMQILYMVDPYDTKIGYFALYSPNNSNYTQGPSSFRAIFEKRVDDEGCHSDTNSKCTFPRGAYNYYKKMYLDPDPTPGELTTVTTVDGITRFSCANNVYFDDWAYTEPRSKTNYNANLKCFADAPNVCKDSFVYWSVPMIGTGSMRIHPEHDGHPLQVNEETTFKRSVENSISPSMDKILDKYIELYPDLKDKKSSEQIAYEIYEAIFKELINVQEERIKKDYATNLLILPEFMKNWIREVYRGKDYLSDKSVKEMILDVLEKKAKELADAGDESGAELVQGLLDNQGNMDEVLLVTLDEYFDLGNLEVKDASCGAIFGEPDDKSHPAYWIQLTLNIIRIAGIGGLFLLSSMDVFKALIAQDNDAIKKASSTALKRFIYTIILFFLPILIKLLFTQFNWYGTIEVCSEIV